MKKYIYISILITISSILNAQFYPVDTAKLNTAYKELISDPNSFTIQKKFFDSFPNTWMEFIMTYQYFPSKEYDLTMYRNAEKHIRAFGEKTTLIDDSIYCEKLVNIAVGGRWDADAPNSLQELLHQIMKEKTKTLFNAVSQLELGSQMQFWQYYWSNLHYNKRYEDELKWLNLKLSNDYPNEIEIMEIAFKYFCGGISLPHDFIN